MFQRILIRIWALRLHNLADHKSFKCLRLQSDGLGSQNGQ